VQPDQVVGFQTFLFFLRKLKNKNKKGSHGSTDAVASRNTGVTNGANNKALKLSYRNIEP